MAAGRGKKYQNIRAYSYSTPPSSAAAFCCGFFHCSSYLRLLEPSSQRQAIHGGKTPISPKSSFSVHCSGASRRFFFLQAPIALMALIGDQCSTWRERERERERGDRSLWYIMMITMHLSEAAAVLLLSLPSSSFDMDRWK